jgi:Spy/CpxP family protein refolding chaperone
MKFLTPIALSALVFAALPAIAEDGAKGGPGMRPVTGVKVCAPGPKFSMTEDQKDKLSSIRDQYKLATAQKKAELEVAMHQQRELMGKTTIDKSAVLSLQSKINGLKADLSNARIDMALTASSVFTPEQREMFQKRMHGKFGHKGPRGEWGGHKGGFRGGERKFG